MTDSITNLFKQLPKDAKQAQTKTAKASDVQMLKYIAEQIEMKVALGEKFDPKEYMLSLLYQLLCYLILNENGNAKYLWKRFPKELKADSQAVAIWAIGQAMWKSEYSQAFELVDNFLASQANEILKPFVRKLSIEYRRRCLGLVTKSYSSITVKELLGYVSNLKDKSIAGKDNGIGFAKKCIIQDYNLQDIWVLDEKTGIIEIQTAKEEFDLDANLMNEFTQYVVFMEAQQNV